MIRIYIVDNEPMAVRYVEYMLAQSNAAYELVGSSTNSSRALDEILEKKPDVVFTDISMPIMNGLKLAERILRKLSCKVYLLTSYEDFQYAKQGVKIGVADYILKNELTEELLRNLLERAEVEISEERRMQQTLLDRNARDFLFGDSSNSGDNPYLEQANRRCALLAFFEPVRIQMKYAEEPGKKLLDTYALQNSACPQGLHCSAFVRTQRGEYCSIILIDDNLGDSASSVARLAEQFLQEICATNPDWKCIQSEVYRKLDDLPGAYQKMRGFKDFLYVYPDQSLFCIADFAQRHEANLEESEEFLERIQQSLYLKHRSAAISQTRAFFEFSRKNFGIWSYVENARRLYQMIRRNVFRNTLDLDRLAMADVYQNTDELERFLLRCEDAYFESLETAEIQNYSGHIQRAVDYIRKNFSRDISVTDIAEAIGISEGHLRRLFKQELKTSVIDFLTNCRIDWAKMLMRDSRLTLTEIWMRSGFSSSQYFSQVFRKRENMLPKEYMKKLQGECRT